MERQLVLLEQAPDWHLDDRTREIGRDGLAQARAAMQAARRRADDARAEAHASTRAA